MEAIDLHLVDAALPSLARWREVVTGATRLACSERNATFVSRLDPSLARGDYPRRAPSLGIALKCSKLGGFTDMSHLFTARSLGRGASLDSWGR